MSLRIQFKCCSTFSLWSCSSKRTFSAINVVRNKNGGKADCQDHYTLPTKKMLLGFVDGAGHLHSPGQPIIFLPQDPFAEPWGWSGNVSTDVRLVKE